MKTNDPYYGKEPNFSDVIITKENFSNLLGSTLNWYAANETNTNICKWAKEFLEEKNITTKNILDNTIRSLGILVRMKKRGFSFKIEELIQRELQKIRYEKLSEIKEKPQQKIVQKNFVSAYETCIDDIILGKNNVNFSLNDVLDLSERNIILRKAEKLQREITDHTNYFSLKLSVKNNINIFLSSLLQQKLEEIKKPRKPRKKKVKTPKELVKKFSVNLNGNKAEKIIGASLIILYEEETRKIFCYYGKADGLSVRGKVLDNFDEKSSFVKMLRKPNEILPSIVSDTKAQLIKKIKSLSTQEKTGLSGRVCGKMKVMRIFT